MKKWLPLIIVLGIVLILSFWGVGVYNKMIDMKGQGEKSWADVESSYQRRNDLIGNLVKTVQGAADFEKSTLTEVVNARAKATQTKLDVGNLTEANLAQFQQAQAGLSGALSKLLVVVEKYPDLKSSQNFLGLQNQLEGTENRINVARNRYNNTAGEYNIYIKKIPYSMIAGFGNFEGLPLFKSKLGSEDAPDVNFDFNKKE